MHKDTITVAIISGKGGVGKTSFALSLAYALYEEQSSTLLMDCDFGLANIDVMLGIKPKKTLQDLFISDMSPREVIHTVYDGFDILPGFSGISILEEMIYNKDRQNNFIQKLHSSFMSYQYVLMDFSSGIVAPTQIFTDIITVRILIVTPEPSSLSNSYALVKHFLQKHNIKRFFVVINQVEHKEEEQFFERFYTMCRQDMDIEFVLLGYIYFDHYIFDAICNQNFLLEIFPKTKVSEDIKILAKKFISSCSNIQI